ncbi:hypothetical protein [Caulobacter radicis]|uniref:hypothetical protein n=1 Tax=Caulobacter radicis TaxID=2172650 RepID=UPI0010583163|nr:hypothetical protein [Caulobacter radicis]
MTIKAKLRRRFIYLAVSLFVVGLVLLALGAVDGTFRIRMGGGKFKTIAESNLSVRLAPASSVSWMSEGEVAFVGEDRNGGAGIYIWKIDNSPKIYRRFVDAAHGKYLCAENGRISYSESVDGDGPVIVRSGAPGREVEQVLRPWIADRDFDYGQQINQIAVGSTSITGRRCKIYVDPAKRGRSWLANYTQDAYLDLGVRWAHGAVSFEDIKSGDKRPLPISISEESILSVETPSWDGSFFLWPRGNFSNPQSEFLGYRIYRTGAFERVSVKGSSAFLDGKFFPYRDGYLLVTSGGGARGQGGLYTVESGDLRRKIGGNLVAISLSPSGCRLAVAEFASTIPETWNLKIIQLCDGVHND